MRHIEKIRELVKLADEISVIKARVTALGDAMDQEAVEDLQRDLQSKEGDYETALYSLSGALNKDYSY